jgi:hypothetical protein
MYSLERFSFDDVISNEMSPNRDFLGLVTHGVDRFIVFAPS